MPDPTILMDPAYAPFAAIAIFLIGIVVGASVARLLLPSRQQLRRLTADLEKLRADHHTYRGSVTRHFETTSELVANLTESYKAVYDHLATGARSLCEPTKALEPGEFGAPRLVFDERLDLGGASGPPQAGEGPENTPAQLAGTRAREDARTDPAEPETVASHEPPTLEMTKKNLKDLDEASGDADDEKRAQPSLH